MSPKQSSLAYDEVKDQNHENLNDQVSFEPELSLLISTRLVGGSAPAHMIPIAGRVTVSF